MRPDCDKTLFSQKLYIFYILFFVIYLAGEVSIAKPTSVIHNIPDIDDQTASQAIFPGGVASFRHGVNCETEPCEWRWDFGDGTTELVRTPASIADYAETSHVYSSLGVYPVLFTITDNAGVSKSLRSYVLVVEDESLKEYVDTCKRDLGFSDSDIPDNMNCAAGLQFELDKDRAVNDFIGYHPITSEVDLVFACRWLQSGKRHHADFTDPPFKVSASVEMIMHNRVSGDTCFFKSSARQVPIEGSDPVGGRFGVPVEIVSPTVAANAPDGSYEAGYWIQPFELANKMPCVDCHAAGPYIASPRITPYLARFGLLNDGHDTFGRYFPDGPLAAHETHGRYSMPGKTFHGFSELAAHNNRTDECASSCHSIASGDGIETIVFPRPPGVQGIPIELIPSINMITKYGEPEISIIGAGLMPPNAPVNGDDPELSDFTWINEDTPLPSSDVGDVETIFTARKKFGPLLSYCGQPHVVEAHVVGSDLVFHGKELPDKLTIFNSAEGLLCENNKQQDGTCENYNVRYRCTDSKQKTGWTKWKNNDFPLGINGQDDERVRVGEEVCAASELMHDIFSNPLPVNENLNSARRVSGIQARATLSNGWTYSGFGPDDRLAEFNNNGLVCLNEEQPDGQCSNYVVKYIACDGSEEAYTASFAAISSKTLVTAAGTTNNADVRGQPFNVNWNTQTWVIEAEEDSEFVRIKSIASGKYLQVRSDTEGSPLEIHDYRASWDNQRWLIEPIENSTNVRLRDAMTNRYLTLNNYGNYSQILSQSLNPGWDTQAWQIN